MIPKEVVKWIKNGVKRHWWAPVSDLARSATDGGATDGRTSKRRNPLAGAHAADTGEGTRYGKRPRRPDKKHLDSPTKPQQ